VNLPPEIIDMHFDISYPSSWGGAPTQGGRTRWLCPRWQVAGLVLGAL
jgi:hypothetical protein